VSLDLTAPDRPDDSPRQREDAQQLSGTLPAAGVGVAAISVFLMFAAVGLCQSSGSNTADIAAFRAICGSCHSVSLVDGLRTEDEWREEVDQMIKIGARGTEQQFARVMRVLARTLTIVSVNSADARQIALVLDVSDAVAENVVKRRQSVGKYKTLADLKEVPGMDLQKLEARKDRIIF